MSKNTTPRSVLRDLRKVPTDALKRELRERERNGRALPATRRRMVLKRT